MGNGLVPKSAAQKIPKIVKRCQNPDFESRFQGKQSSLKLLLSTARASEDPGIDILKKTTRLTKAKTLASH